MQAPPTSPKVHCVSLACRVVHEHFGQLPAVVAEVLLRKGRQTFPELLRNINSSNRTSRQLHLSTSIGGSQQGPSMTAGQLKQVLLVLIQQNFLMVRLQPSEVMVTGVKPAVHIYEADLGQMLQLIRRPKFVQHIRDESAANPHRKSEADSLIVEVLLEHGRLRYDQIVQAVLSRMTDTKVKSEEQQQTEEASPHALAEGPSGEAAGAAADADAGTDGMLDSSPSTMVWWAFLQLLQERYIERAPPCNLPPLLPKSSAPARAKKAAPKPGTVEYAEMQLRQQQLQQHQDYEDMRFRSPSELAPNAPPGNAAAAEAAAGAGDAERDAAAAAAAAAAIAATQQRRKRKKTAGGITAEDAAAAAAAEAAAAAADTAAAARAAAALSRKKRKTNAGGSQVAAASEMGDAAAAALSGVAVKVEQPEVKSAATVAADKRKRKAAAAAGAELPSAQEVLWRVNTEEFNRRFRNQDMVKIVSEKLGQDSGSVLAAMLAHACRFEIGVNTEVSVNMSVGDVMAALTAGQESGRLPELREDTTVAEQLKALAWDSLNCVELGPTGPLGETYYVNMANVLDRIKLQQLNRVLLDKFGPLGMRVFNTLLHNGQLEPKQIADFIMREHKETRELLYRMLKAGYLQMQDIPKSAERAPSRCFYTFKADVASTCARLVGDMFQAADNLHARMTHEVSRHADVLDLVEAAQAAGQLNFNMTAGSRIQLERLYKVTNALHLSLLRLDGQLALFNEYTNYM